MNINSKQDLVEHTQLIKQAHNSKGCEPKKRPGWSGPT